MHIQSVENLVEVEFFSSGFVIDNPDIARSVLFGNVNTVNRAFDFKRSAVGQGNVIGINLAVAVNAQLKCDRNKVAVGKFCNKPVNDLTDGETELTEEVIESFTHFFAGGQIFFEIFLKNVENAFVTVCFLHGAKSVTAVCGNQLFKYIVYRCALLHRIKLSGLSRLSVQSVFAEIFKRTLVINLGSRG